MDLKKTNIFTTFGRNAIGEDFKKKMSESVKIYLCVVVVGCVYDCFQ